MDSTNVTCLYSFSEAVFTPYSKKQKNKKHMRYTKIWMMAVLCCLSLGNMQALTLPEEEPVLVYYMPLTQLKVTVEYDEVVTEVGQFYQYSERYLGTKDVITKAEKQFVLNNVKVTPSAIADPAREYVLSDKSAKLQLISLTPFGTLAGYNMEPKDEWRKAKDYKFPAKTKNETKIGTETTSLMPLLEEQLMASSTAKMAEGAAKQIYRIREMRLNILGGDVEKYPADGEALKLVLAELNKREKELTALFVGRRIVTHHVKELTYTPKAEGKKEEGILFRFSKYYGVVATDDLSGEPIHIAISKTVHQLQANEKPSQKPGTSIYYNLPSRSEMTVTYGEQELVRDYVDIAQWGVSVPVNAALLNGTTKIQFNPLTGNIVSIDK